jgi:hypothetical protein
MGVEEPNWWITDRKAGKCAPLYPAELSGNTDSWERADFDAD